MTSASFMTASAPLGEGKPIIPDIQRLNGDLAGIPCTIRPGETIQLDWGRKRTGRVYLAGDGVVDFVYCSNIALFQLSGQVTYWRFPNFVAADAMGTVALTEQPNLLQSGTIALRYLRLTNSSSTTVEIRAVTLEPSEYAKKAQGSFKCSDQDLDVAWRMGIDTLHLCTQPGEESQIPVFAPFGEGYVQWDGCRRDREIWGGDLRPGALAWYYNFVDQSPIANSLYVLMSGQHVDCSEHGLFPGSGSSRQKFYEWAFWEVICLHEYIIHTGDRKLVGLARYSLPMFLQWCERKLGETSDGFVHTDRSWMYTIKLEKQALPSLQIVAIMGLRAMGKIFQMLGLTDCANRACVLEKKISQRFHQSFWEESLSAYRFAHLSDGILRSDLCTNCWALLADLVPMDLVQGLLSSLRERHWTRVGSINITPGLEHPSAHDNTIWPYANAYEITARFHAGDVEGALTVLRRYVMMARHLRMDTIPEMIGSDGSLPILEDGNILSLCHAWAAQASWALQRFLLGVYPVEMGWRRFAVEPVLSPLKWLEGSVVTPQGLIDITLERDDCQFKGKVVYPNGIDYVTTNRVVRAGRIEYIQHG